MKQINLTLISATAVVLFLLSLNSAAQNAILGYCLCDGDVIEDTLIQEGHYLHQSLSTDGDVQTFISAGKWSLATPVEDMKDLNGDGGLEILIHAGLTLIVVNSADESIQSYRFSTMNWSVLPHGVAQMDAFDGAEIAVRDNDDVTIVTHRTHNRSKYSGLNDGQTKWTLIANGVQDVTGDGKVDIIIRTDGGIRIISHFDRNTKFHKLKFGFTLIGLENFDLNQPPDIAIGVGQTIIIIRPYDQSSRVYDIGESWTINEVSDRDQDGAFEITINVKGGIKIVDDVNKKLR